MTSKRKPAYRKLATATTVEKIEAYINEFVFGGHYRVNPGTLEITNELGTPPAGWFVMEYRGGYLFGRRNDA